jgi:SAM-dependent methyltransferase
MQRDMTYDAANDRLVFITRAPDQEYWEELWQKSLTHTDIARGDRFVLSETASVLPRGARVVDAGCGIGATVYGLSRAGFDAYGIDYAEATVAEIKALFPDLNVDVADIRAMPFADGGLDGVWSLGVIEHFFDSYDSIIEEARRVLRPGGYLFLTVPVISPLKAMKIRLGLYRRYETTDRDNFFQFAFRKQGVVEQVKSHGFRMLRTYGRSGTFGLTEDLGPAAKLFLPSQGNTALWARACWRGIDMIVTPFSHHSRYFLFEKIGH